LKSQRRQCCVPFPRSSVPVNDSKEELLGLSPSSRLARVNGLGLKRYVHIGLQRVIPMVSTNTSLPRLQRILRPINFCFD
jgi:hypothetical protein